MTVLEGRGRPLLLVPFTTDHYGNCDFVGALQLIEIDGAQLRTRGAVEQRGFIQRTLLVGGSLLSISDAQLLAVNLDDRDFPVIEAQLSLAIDTPSSTDGRYPRTCDVRNDGPMLGFEDDMRMYGCNVGGRGDASPLPVWLLLALPPLLARPPRRHHCDSRMS